MDQGDYPSKQPHACQTGMQYPQSHLHAIGVLSPAAQASPYPLPPAQCLPPYSSLLCGSQLTMEMFPITAHAITVQV